MNLAEVLEVWLGALDPPAGDPVRDQERTLYLGAGFTKAAFNGAPLFNEYRDVVLRAIFERQEGLPESLRRLESDGRTPPEWEGASITDLIEILHDLAGRRQVIESLLVDPGPASFALQPGRCGPFRNLLPDRMDGVYRTLDQWKSAIRRSVPTHMRALDPVGPPITLGRLVYEGIVRQVMTTNWDDYVEVGCWLAGIQVSRHDNAAESSLNAPHPRSREDGWCMEVHRFDCPRDVALYPRRADSVPLLKLHGGVDHVVDTLRKMARGTLTREQADAALEEGFLVATSDLTDWRDASQWVADAVGDAFRTSRVLLLGVSGEDTVTFRAARSRIQEWERRNRESALEARGRFHSDEGPREVRRHHAPLVAADFAPKPRLACMMMVRHPDGPARVQAARADAGFTLRAAYAWHLLRHILTVLTSGLPRAAAELSRRLTPRLEAEVACGDGTRAPLVALLSEAVGPSARWAALAEARPPFSRFVFLPETYWWYAPWTRPAPNEIACQAPGNEIPVSHALQIAGCLEVLSRSRARGRPSLEIDPWTGVVRVLDTHPCTLLRDRNLLLMPWPWPLEEGVESPMLRSALREWATRIPGRSLGALASPRTWIVPLADPENARLRQQVGDRRHLLVGNARKDLVLLDWYLEPHVLQPEAGGPAQ